MSRKWFTAPVETVATFWRILRRDGVAVGLISHDRDIWLDGVLHRASPGMVPSSIRKSADLEPDSAEVRGALSHEALDATDLAAGRFDAAQVRIGLVDWETGESEVLYAGTIGAVAEEDGAFSAELISRKAELWRDPVPRTSPTCRAAFCGPGCNLNPLRFTREVTVAALHLASNAVLLREDQEPALSAGGSLRWLEGPLMGAVAMVMGDDGAGGLVLDLPLDEGIPGGTRALLREGCAHTLDTCAARFGNAANFRGEPYLPGNDMLTRYPGPMA